ncbi:MAG: DNA methyltransferase [Sphingomonas sp.]
MTPHEFLTKWRHVELKERSASQSHFNDLCALLGVLDPISADPTGDWFTFERGASKTSGGEGWADVWRKGCFGWEYKGRHANLDRANNQLLQYSVALENPPLLIVSDMDRIVIRTNWTNTVQEKHEFALDDLIDGAVRDRLKAAFTDPDAFKPQKSRQELTEETAGEFAGLAQRLRDRGHEAHQVAHFVNRLVFCMFAEDVGLLPDTVFTKMLEVSRRNPAEFAGNASTLFGAMAHKGGKVGFTAIEWFNGGLFEDDHVLPVSADDIDALLSAARRDWSQIDPSILGTLFERGLDPAKRSQLGAHYTDRDKIMMIVRPTIIEPIETEWAKALEKISALVESTPKRTVERLLTPAERRKVERIIAEAAAIHSTFIERLANFRVLDPACGSGNFLYVALRSLKDLEHRANLDAEALGLPRGFPRVGPECVLGIELNPYAAELARVSVWIGEIQWMRRNGFDAAKNPILRPLDTIECRDAVLNDDGTRAEWPDADVVIGNPPFLGSKYLRKGRPATKSKPALQGLGDAYVDAVFASYHDIVPASADLVAYWFANTHRAAKGARTQAFGMIATKSIGKGTSNRPLAAIFGDTDFRIFQAWQNEPWVVDGAQVRVAIVCAKLNANEFLLDGAMSGPINADLTCGVDVSLAGALTENRGRAFQGAKLNGPFEIAAAIARSMLRAPSNPNGLRNQSVVRRFVGNDDVTMRDRDAWVIDFTDFPALEDAALFEQPFAYVEREVLAHRDGLAVAKTTEVDRLSNYWLMQRPRPKLRSAAALYETVIAVPETSEHMLFRFLPRDAVFSGSVSLSLLTT